MPSDVRSSVTLCVDCSEHPDFPGGDQLSLLPSESPPLHLSSLWVPVHRAQRDDPAVTSGAEYLSLPKAPSDWFKKELNGQ